MEIWSIPGVSIGLLHEGSSLFLSLGVTSVETDMPISSNTLFPAGSVSKSFTATLIMTLVEEGRVELDVPVVEYVPDLILSDPEAQKQVTLRQLLTHTSGIFGDYFDDHGQGDDALEKALQQYSAIPQIHPPGSLWAYSNSSFCLAGAVAARVLGTTYEAALLDRVVRPLEMDRTMLFPHEAITYPLAVGHVLSSLGEPEVNRGYLVTRYMNPAAGVISTAEDMMRFAAFHLGEGPSLLSDSSLQMMQSEQVEAANRADYWGLGWGIKDLGTRVLEHTGSVNGTAAQLTFVPENSLGVCVLANGALGLGATRAICNWILENYCGLNTAPPEAVALEATHLCRFSGVYRQPSGDVRVSVVDGHLRINPATGASFTAYPIDEYRFVIREGVSAGLRVEFVPGCGNEPAFVNINGRLLAKVE